MTYFKHDYDRPDYTPVSVAPHLITDPVSSTNTLYGSFILNSILQTSFIRVHTAWTEWICDEESKLEVPVHRLKSLTGKPPKKPFISGRYGRQDR